MFKIMIVEDDETIRDTISDTLQKWNFETFTTTDFTETLNNFIAEKPHLVLLDINLPVYDGFYWCQKIREISKAPILFISSRNTNMDMVMAMNMGADDFLTKPIELPVLLAKIQGLLRRTYEYQTSSDGVYTSGTFTLQSLDNRVTDGKTAVDLSPTETRILRMLFATPGQVVNREDIITRLWENDAFVDQNTLAVTMTRLRQKVSGISLDQAIQNVRGQGFRLGAEGDA